MSHWVLCLDKIPKHEHAKNEDCKFCFHTPRFSYQQSPYSHSIVAGGLLLISYTTRLIPFTLLIMSLETCAKKS